MKPRTKNSFTHLFVYRILFLSLIRSRNNNQIVDDLIFASSQIIVNMISHLVNDFDANDSVEYGVFNTENVHEHNILFKKNNSVCG